MDREVTLCLTGDVMLGRGVDQIFASSCPPRLHEPHVDSALRYVELAERAHGPIPEPVAPAYPWGEALDEVARLRPAAFVVNLETSVTAAGHPARKGIHYRMHPANVESLVAAGVDCAVLANNHVLDWGRGGLLETLASLEEAGIRTAGAGVDLEAARAPAVLELASGRRLLVFAFGFPDAGIPPDWAAGPERAGVAYLPGYSEESADLVLETVRARKEEGDLVLLSLHWGSNWGYRIPRGRRRFARRLVERGAADMIHGHSSHHPRGLEVHGDRLILHGCGDLLNDYEGIGGRDGYRSDLTLLYAPRLKARTGTLGGLTMSPFRVRRFRLEAPSPAERGWLAETMDRECRRFGGRVRSTEEGRLVLDRGDRSGGGRSGDAGRCGDCGGAGGGRATGAGRGRLS